MIQVTMNKDIRDYEPKLFGIVTARQAIILAVGLMYSVPIAVFVPAKDITARIVIGAICIAPAILIGWIKVYGMRLDQFIWEIIKTLILTPKKRKFVVEPAENSLDFKTGTTQTAKIKTSPDYPAHK